MTLPKQVEIREVGPRDGLQNEKIFIPTDLKVQWINLISETGVRHIEVSSFVSPKWIPALADHHEVFEQIARHEKITYAALVPNLKGIDGAIQQKVDEIALFISASEEHNQSNVNASINQSLQNLKAVAEAANREGISLRGYISTVFGSPFGDEVKLQTVKEIIDAYLAMGVSEISLGDTIGVADPVQVKAILSELLTQYDSDLFALHFHDTYGRALANIFAALELGITKYDSAIGGLGGCPYAPGASGNVSTNDLVNFLHRLGVQTNIDEEKLFTATRFLQQAINRQLDSKVYKVQSN
ncbi:hydroxymethylglutaryl-CoA lyase [Lysinibacillus capsici]|uniref:hydroxymethylglutaryl-CoA lyase n=1 Tax=Lysinibacillus capsici TaxID=2115968 RepID=UPI00273121B6|nr:hydroxymethylglutaryl-CoA lyase [Lysinibacillus capsici]MDP1394465.1 hydroxymethylglutaryl-CoA lyase [Lysinibacillus capsici]MDP1414866.1 hydroxymethylglutaryl-CoA lyase [Lysinibacillus capsici]MDP1430759.1 hydroxymethylglutaryl-CoA lyase [Lysinibacillus capsici]